jgi:hypothetical protein
MKIHRQQIMKFLYIILFIVLGIALLTLILYLKWEFPLRPKEDGFEFVYVEIDGSVRELDEDEKKYLQEEFHPTDGARPYIKTSYKELTPDNKIWGFIKRKCVPRHIKIKPFK